MLFYIRQDIIDDIDQGLPISSESIKQNSILYNFHPINLKTTTGAKINDDTMTNEPESTKLSLKSPERIRMAENKLKKRSPSKNRKRGLEATSAVATFEI